MPRRAPARQLVVATIERPGSRTGAHTHVQELRRYLGRSGAPPALVTPYSWGGPLSLPVFGARMGLERLSTAASVRWYYHWHEVFLHRALQRHLARTPDVVVYAQDPRAARAALRARHGAQRVLMAVHFQGTEAAEWAANGKIRRDGAVYERIRRLERETVPRLDGIVYVSEAAREELLDWLPEAAAVPSAVIPNFVSRVDAPRPSRLLGDLVTLGRIEPIKNQTYLAEVLAAARRAGRSYTLDVYGDGSMRGRLVQRARALGVGDLVRVRGFRADARRSLPGYRAYVHASLRESQSLAIVEAQAAGLPVLAGDVGGVRSVCDEGSGARFWPLDDEERAAAILIDLLDDEAARRRAAAASLLRFQGSFDADVVAPRLHAFLTGIDGDRAAPDTVLAR